MVGDIRIGIIGGSGVGDALVQGVGGGKVERHEVNTPFGQPSSPIITGAYGGVPIALLKRHGEGHVFSPSAVPVRANIFALKSLGCTHIIATGACGSLRDEIHPGDLVICDQLIDRTYRRANTFYEAAAVHVEFADPFCPVMRQWLLDAAQSLDEVRVHKAGCYVCMEGPAFSTRAESHMHRQWGADVVGMTAMPEAKLAREAEIAYALVALATDYDCWRQYPTAAVEDVSLLEEILGNLNRATAASIELIKAALSDISQLTAAPSPAHSSLKLAIWSDKSKMNCAEIERLGPLWGRYFME